jgi:hypothetical protein
MMRIIQQQLPPPRVMPPQPLLQLLLSQPLLHPQFLNISKSSPFLGLLQFMWLFLHSLPLFFRLWRIK